MIVFENFVADAMTGSSERIAQIRTKVEKYIQASGIVSCPFEGMVCFFKG